MPVAELLGDHFQVYLDIEDPQSFTLPSWQRQTSIGDIGFDWAKEQVEIPKRKSVKGYQGGRQDWEFTFTMNYDRDNAFHQLVIAHIENSEPLHLALTDGILDDDAENLWHAWWLLTGPLDASLDTNANIEITAKVHTYAGSADDEDPEHEDVSA